MIVYVKAPAKDGVFSRGWLVDAYTTVDGGRAVFIRQPDQDTDLASVLRANTELTGSTIDAIVSDALVEIDVSIKQFRQLLFQGFWR